MKKSIHLDRLQMGVCYYPEHWPETLWESDLRRMQKSGIEVVRIAEFAWSKFEHTEGRFSFAFFDRFLELVAKTKIKVIFCTPTATPPAWLTQKYPEVLCVEKDGQPHRHGMRRQYNYNSPVYREKTRIIVGALAQHYAGHPSIVGWQIDNELNCVTDEFYSDADHAAFRRYVRDKYLTLEALNRAWGTVFWNQEYTDWDEIFLPMVLPRNTANPHLRLDAIRFFSDSCISYCKLQYDILRAYLPENVFITTNGMFNHVDYNKMTDDALDFLMYDSYPTFGLVEGALYLRDRKWSHNLAKARAVSPQFGVMEQQSGPGGWVNFHKAPTPKPGQIRLWAFQSIAHGADYIGFFRWRTCTFGTEIYWHGILDYDNADNRRLKEIRQIAADMSKASGIAGSSFQAKVAILCDYDNEWDAEYDVWHGPLLKASMANWSDALQLSHTPFDYVNVSGSCSAEELRKYEFIVYPHPTIVTDAIAKMLEEYVCGGGKLMIGARSGYKDSRGQCPMIPMPGKLSKLFGVEVHDFTYLGDGEQERHAVWDGKPIDMILFNDILSPVSESCRVLAAFAEDYYKGQPAVTVNPCGKGEAYYVGAAFGRDTARFILDRLKLSHPLDSLIQIPECCELAVRRKGSRDYLFILNYSGEKQHAQIKKPLRDLLTDQTLSGEILLESYGVNLLEIPI